MAANDALGPAWCGLIILGIGLYPVKDIVAAHNGDVNVTSGAKEGIILTMRRHARRHIAGTATYRNRPPTHRQDRSLANGKVF